MADAALHGHSIIEGAAVGSGAAGAGAGAFRAENPAAGQPLEPPFYNASPDEVARAAEAAAAAYPEYRKRTPEQIAAFLERIAANLEELGDSLVQRAHLETGLPLARLTGERARTAGQLRMFAGVVREGSWVDARIDHALPNRTPPRPDLRRMLIPIGPVAVFGASNFPLAFSAPGGDTASALAAGCPVVVKAHPSHPGTSEMAGEAIARAARETGMPAGVFSLLHGEPAISRALVEHPLIEAVAFTGSLRAGRALFDAAAARPRPIPVYAEMGSINPVFVLPGALRERGEALAEGLATSVTLGVGQFCTNPGVIVGFQSPELQSLLQATAQRMEATAPGTMLNRGICQAFTAGLEKWRAAPGVTLQGQAAASAGQGGAALFSTDAGTFLSHEDLAHELFGPSSLVVACTTPAELEAVARGLEGQLTATIHGTAGDLDSYAGLVQILETKVGRLIFNGYPTGVEVSPAINHGGPYPATTDVRSTSVGTAAILRFARPICYQEFPPTYLPLELQEENPRGIWRLVDGEMAAPDR